MKGIKGRCEKLDSQYGGSFEMEMDDDGGVDVSFQLKDTAYEEYWDSQCLRESFVEAQRETRRQHPGGIDIMAFIVMHQMLAIKKHEQR